MLKKSAIWYEGFRTRVGHAVSLASHWLKQRLPTPLFLTRFLSEDPILAPFTPLAVGLCRLTNKTLWRLPDKLSFPNANMSQFFNGYAYVENNPIRFRDPSGLECTPSPDQAELCRAAASSTPYAVCAGTAYNSFGTIDCSGNPTKRCMRKALNRAIAQCVDVQKQDPTIPSMPPTCTTGMAICIEQSKLPEY